MPLPRFLRLPEQRQNQLLATARRHLAEHGAAKASYNRIIAEAGISKTSAYLYFDGKEDLIATVRAHAEAQLAAVLGAWKPVQTSSEFWSELQRGSETLRAELVRQPEMLAVLGETGAAHRPEGQQSPLDLWLQQMLDNGVEIGIIRGDLDRALLYALTRGAIQALDEWAIAKMMAGETVDTQAGWQAIGQLWSSPR